MNFYTDVHARYLRIIGAHENGSRDISTDSHSWSMPDCVRRVLALIAHGDLQPGAIINHRVSPDDLPDVYQRLAEGTLTSLGIMVDWKGYNHG